MLNIVQITGLFGMYDYTVDLQQSSTKGLLFLTGPNGMGKSTILRLVYALYKKDFTTLSTIDYRTAQFVFDACTITLERKKTVELVDEKSDVPSREVITLSYSYTSHPNEGEKPFTEECTWNYTDKRLKKSTAKNAHTNSMDLLMESEKCLYIADNRLSQNTGDEVIYSPEHLKQFVEKLKVKLTDAMIPVGIVENKPFNALEERKANVIMQLENLESCGIEFPSQKESLASAYPDVVWYTCRSCERAFETCSEDIEKLRLFREILKDSHFIDKDLELSMRRGYRFISKNEDRTILSYDMLSSGERHMIMQLMMLLISPQKISLVLIDEPEISFHLMWQMQYLKHIVRIQRLRKCAILVATHSTQIFDSDFTLTTDLWRQHRK